MSELNVPIAPAPRSRQASEEPDAPLPDAAHVLEVARRVLVCSAIGDPHLLDSPITLTCGHSLCSGCLQYIREQAREDSAISVRSDREGTPTVFTTDESQSHGNPADRCLCPVEACRTGGHARPSIVPGREPRVDVVLKKTLEHVKDANVDQLDPQFVDRVLEDLDCHICAGLYHRPISLVCGHTFCSQCFSRAQDHSPTCPLCRTQLPGPAFFTAHPKPVALSELIRLAFGSLWAQRETQDLRALRDESTRVPLFVCSLSLPGQPTPLHVFEPRYRLMST